MLPAPEEVVFRMRQAILDGEHWFEALLDGVSRWRVPEETIGNRHYQYLIHGEAFDWLLLAERLLDDVSFDAARHEGQSVRIDRAYVDARLEALSQNEDLSRFIL